MKIAEKFINDDNLNEVIQFTTKPETVINLDENDVKSVLVGKEGMLYRANKDYGVDNKVFMTEFFEELKKKEFVKTCKYVLLSIGMEEDNPLCMEDMDIIHEFMDDICNDESELEFKWGLTSNNKGESMFMIAICTRDPK